VTTVEDCQACDDLRSGRKPVRPGHVVFCSVGCCERHGRERAAGVGSCQEPDPRYAPLPCLRPLPCPVHPGEESVFEREKALEEAAVMLEAFAGYDDKVGDRREAEANRHAARCIRGLKIPGKTVRCTCVPCETLVEACSRSGMCAPCAHEDCEHEETET
jgi:hypothetical protein